MPSLTKRVVDAAKPQAWTTSCGAPPRSGFGLRVYPSGKKVFVAQVRIGRTQRRVKIGAFGPFTVEQARKRAEEVVRAASEGRDPQREKREARTAITIAELCDAYLEAARAGLVITRFRRAKRPSTVAIDEGRIARHVKPLLGQFRPAISPVLLFSAWPMILLRGRPPGVSQGSLEAEPLSREAARQRRGS